MDPEQLQIVLNQLAQTLGLPPPPPLTPDQLTSGDSVISQLLAALGMAGNMGDPEDMAAAEAGQAERDLQAGEALAKFPANEEQSAQAMQQLLGTFQQIPQALSGMGQSGGGLMQPLNQLLQQGAQMGQQFAGQLGNAGAGADLAGELPEVLGDTLGTGGALAGAAGGGLGTVPAGNLAPPATPSAATFPSAASSPPPPSAPESAGMGRGGMGGYPMMPPGGAGGAPGAGDAKPDTKRVVPPSVKNGAPVQGRISAPKPPEVTKRVHGKPVANRRVVAAGQKPDDEDTEPDR